MEQAGSTPALALMPLLFPTIDGPIVIPDRESDCSGVRPAWYPFQINVCDWACDDPDPVELSERHFAIPDAE